MARINNKYLNDFEFVLWVLQGCEAGSVWDCLPHSDECEEAVNVVRSVRDVRPELGLEEKNELMRRIRVSYLKSKSSNHKKLMLVVSICSVVAVCLILVLGHRVFKSSGLEVIVYVAESSVSVIDLKDGSKVWLCPGSRLTCPVAFDSDIRVVTLEGEAFFEVAHNPEWPFEVRSEFMSATALSTSFDMKVSFDPSQTQHVLLVDGSVGVEINGHGGQVLLRPSELLSYNNDSYLVREVNPEDFLSWTGLYQNIISGVNSISEIASKISSHYHVTVRGSESVMSIKCSGKLVLFDNIYQTLDVLTYVAPISYSVSGNGEIILKKK